MKSPLLDSIDRKIINRLQLDCRVTLKCIARQVGLTPPAVAERITRLEEHGIIRGHTVGIDRLSIGYPISGFILVAPRTDRYHDFCGFCENCENIDRHYRLDGAYQALLHFAVRKISDLDLLLQHIKSYGNSVTSIELGVFFDRKDL